MNDIKDKLRQNMGLNIHVPREKKWLPTCLFIVFCFIFELKIYTCVQLIQINDLRLLQLSLFCQSKKLLITVFLISSIKKPLIIIFVSSIRKPLIIVFECVFKSHVSSMNFHLCLQMICFQKHFLQIEITKHLEIF